MDIILLVIAFTNLLFYVSFMIALMNNFDPNLKTYSVLIETERQVFDECRIYLSYKT